MLAEHPAGRLLVAGAENSPFAFFAWPAGSPKALGAGLSVLLDCWPHHAVLSASPALAALDTSGRLRSSAEASRLRLLLPEAPSAASASLLAMVVGAPCLLFGARAGKDSDTSGAFVARFITKAARVRLAYERMEVILRDHDLDLPIRRAGLDRDPGWLPWLRRTVRFVYHEHQPSAGGSA
jgi:hypothetical protein